MFKTIKTLPKNAGAPWTSEVDSEFLQMLSDNKNIEECAIHFERTKGSIIARKLHIARRMVSEGQDIEKVSEIVKTPVRFIEESIDYEEARKRNKQMERAEKKSRIEPPKEETKLSVLKEIRDLLKKLV
jgi:Arc/MetJ-type ribon-helix-helix transcriptional regulator